MRNPENFLDSRFRGNDMEKNKMSEEKKEEKDDKTEKPEDKSEEYLDNWKRCQADFENYKKDQEKRTIEFRKFANADMIMQIFPVLDNFDSSLTHIPENEKESPWVQGILHIKKQLGQVLKDNGVEEIEAKEGDKFNPEMHEAVKQEIGSEKLEVGKSDNKIKKIVRKGYKIDGKVIRAARVIVD